MHGFIGSWLGPIYSDNAVGVCWGGPRLLLFCCSRLFATVRDLGQVLYYWVCGAAKMTIMAINKVDIMFNYIFSTFLAGLGLHI